MAPSQSSASQKRKATDDGPPKPPPKKLQVQVDASTSTFTPVLANFPSVVPAASTSFSLYQSRDSDRSKPLEDQLTLLAGETAGVEFFSTNRDSRENESVQGKGGYSCRYLLALHDPKTNSLTVAPSPTYLLAHQVKRLKNLESLKSVPDANRLEDRNKLGEAFGTKKAKSRIKTVERNKIDTAGMEHMRSHLEESIQEGAKDLPTQEAIKAISDGARPIPPPNMSATSPSEAYDIKTIISPAAKASIKPFLEQLAACDEDRDRIKLLPFSHSDWVNKRMKDLGSVTKPNKEKLRMVVFISMMRQFERCGRSVGDRPKLVEKMGSTPRVVLDSLIEMFTESPRGSNKPQTTPATEAKLWSYMFVLCLMVDNFSSDINEIAKDLNMPPVKVQTLFKGLGCDATLPTTEERERMGISLAQAKSSKKATLKVPLVFKDPSRGPAKR